MNMLQNIPCISPAYMYMYLATLNANYNFLYRVEVDCRKMFAPGQLGVAISRVRYASDVRVINFNANACISQTDIIADFLEVRSCCQRDDYTCCRYKR